MSHALAEWETDQNLYLFTSLTAGSSHIITATSRIETILRANRLHFTYIDTATNESARKLWGRRSRGKRLPALVKEGEIIGDLAEIEELNEFGELKDAVGKLPPPGENSIVTTPAKMAGPYSNPPSNAASPANAASSASAAAKAAPASPSPAAKQQESKPTAQPAKENQPAAQSMQQQLAAEAASKGAERKKKEIADLKATLLAEKSADVSEPTPAEPPVPEKISTVAAVESSESVTSSAPKAASPSSASTSRSASVLPPQSPTAAYDPPVKEHRGSSLSLVSDEEIKEIEAACAISEEDEEDEEEATETTAGNAAQKEEKVALEDVKPSQDKTSDVAPTSPKKETEDMKASLSKVIEARSQENMDREETTTSESKDEKAISGGTATSESTSTISDTTDSTEATAKDGESAVAKALTEDSAIPKASFSNESESALPVRGATHESQSQDVSTEPTSKVGSLAGSATEDKAEDKADAAAQPKDTAKETAGADEEAE